MENPTESLWPKVTLKVRELHPLYGDRVTTMTLDEAKELDYNLMATVMPDGTVVHSFDQLLEVITKNPIPEEIEITRFPALAGG